MGLASVLSDEEEEQEDPPLARVSRSQANDCIRQLQAYFQTKSYDTSCQLQKLIDMESDINSVQKLEQSKLSNFFKPWFFNIIKSIRLFLLQFNRYNFKNFNIF